MIKETDSVQPSIEQAEAIQDIRNAAQAYIDLLKSHEPSREMSIALTNAETSAMWAVKAVTRT
jgi:hypothetical protein